jgi:hypothetical protein
VLALLLSSAGLLTPAAHERANGVTWIRDVEPIVQRRCGGCHRPGGVARSPLTDFDAATRLAPKIRKDVLTRRMPPWPAAAGFGEFANDGSLTPYEIELIVSWTQSGMQRGVSETPPAIPQPAISPTPDLVLRVDGETPIVSRRQRYVLRTNERHDRWIHGWEFTPGNEALVRQARITIDSGELGVWVPPRSPVFLPDGVAQRLRAGATLTIDVEYERPESPATDRSSLGLYLGSAPARELRHMDLARGTATIREDMLVLAVRPELDRASESLRLLAQRPGGDAEALVWVREFDEQYRVTYRFRRPVALPSGTRLSLFSFDGTSSAHLEYVRQ